VLFFKPETQEIAAIKTILGIFGEASGLKVNYNKTTATIIRGDLGVGTMVKERLGSQLLFLIIGNIL
jgi:hypothetical protein